MKKWNELTGAASKTLSSLLARRDPSASSLNLRKTLRISSRCTSLNWPEGAEGAVSSLTNPTRTSKSPETVARDLVERMGCHLGYRWQGERVISYQKKDRGRSKTYSIPYISKANRRILASPSIPTTPPRIQPQTDFTQVLLSNSIFVPDDYLYGFSSETSRIAHGEFQFRFTSLWPYGVECLGDGSGRNAFTSVSVSTNSRVSLP